MSKSKQYRNYVKRNRAAHKPVLAFEAWVELADRLVVARKARAATPKAKRSFATTVVANVKARQVAAKLIEEPKAPKFTRIENRVDCFSNQGASMLLGVDKGHGGTMVALFGGVIVDTYSSKRGERERVLIPAQAKVAQTLTKAGFNPRGF